MVLSHLTRLKRKYIGWKGRNLSLLWVKNNLKPELGTFKWTEWRFHPTEGKPLNLRSCYWTNKRPVNLTMRRVKYFQKVSIPEQGLYLFSISWARIIVCYTVPNSGNRANVSLKVFNSVLDFIKSSQLSSGTNQNWGIFKSLKLRNQDW